MFSWNKIEPDPGTLELPVGDNTMVNWYIL